MKNEMSLDQIGRGRTTSRAKSMCKGWGAHSGESVNVRSGLLEWRMGGTGGEVGVEGLCEQPGILV